MENNNIKQASNDEILIGNTFPMTLVERPMLVVPSTLEELKRQVDVTNYMFGDIGHVHSFWGHQNTQSIAEGLLDCSLGNESRKALTVSENNLPVLDGVEFKEVWVVSPRYIPGFRPAIGVEVEADQITGWQVLRITFPK